MLPRVAHAACLPAWSRRLSSVSAAKLNVLDGSVDKHSDAFKVCARATSRRCGSSGQGRIIVARGRVSRPGSAHLEPRCARRA
jgi:hypothetical protein